MKNDKAGYFSEADRKLFAEIRKAVEENKNPKLTTLITKSEFDTRVRWNLPTEGFSIFENRFKRFVLNRKAT